MRAFLTLFVVASFLCSEGQAQKRRVSILVDASQDGGGWWSPQHPEFIARNPHQGKALADYLRRKGAEVEELPSILRFPDPSRRSLETTARHLAGRDLVPKVQEADNQRGRRKLDSGSTSAWAVRGRAGVELLERYTARSPTIGRDRLLTCLKRRGATTPDNRSRGFAARYRWPAHEWDGLKSQT